jgi:hypothetical protein
MKTFIFGVMLTAIAIPTAPAVANQGQDWSNSLRDDRRSGDDRYDRARSERRDDRHKSNNGRHRGHQKRAAWQEYDRYDYNRYDPRYGNYRANRYYRDGGYYQDRRLTNQDRIYRGSDNRYYCRRNDGTTGLIIGAVGGGLLGRTIAPNGSKTLGTILGGAGGALIGRSIGRGGVRCN